MKERDLINIIKTTLNSEYIGDDCAHLKDLGIVITQDSLVEDVHFSLDFITPYELGRKSALVNFSDIYASGTTPKYLTVSLSMPADIDEDFVESFYEGIKSVCKDSVKVVGGDITGSDKVYISICAIGATEGRNISSRANAKIGYKVVVSGVHGSSAAGLAELKKGERGSEFVKAHLEPDIQGEFALEVSGMVKEPYAMMDTSDGLMDALSTIANNSGVLLDVDFNKILYDKEIEQFDNWQDMVLFGGEDYGIVAVIPKKYDVGGVEIGRVKSGLGVDLMLGGEKKHYSKADIENKVFNHFNY